MVEHPTDNRKIEVQFFAGRPNVDKMKQIIVLRKDLNMRKGKMVAQGAHASMKAVLENLTDKRVEEWLSKAFTKIVVSVDNEEEFLQVKDAAIKAGLICAEIIDNGQTEFNNVQTRTALAIGPATHDELQAVTGYLKLL